MNGDLSAIYWFVKLLLYMRIHINKFSCAKYFPSRMMNELNKNMSNSIKLINENYF